MKLKFLFIILCVFFSSVSYGDTSCIRPIKSVTTDATTLNIEHGDGYQRSIMSLNWNDEDQELLSRTLSVVLAGALADKGIRFTYSSAHNGSAASCKPTLIQKLTSVEIIL